MDFLPHSYQAPSPTYTASLLAGVGATVPQVPWLQVDAGAGWDWLRYGSLADGPATSILHLGVRFGPTDRFGVRSSLTLSFEHANILALVENILGQQTFAGTDGSSTWHPGLTLELWWL